MGVRDKKKLLTGIETKFYKLSDFRNKIIVIDSMWIIHKLVRNIVSKEGDKIDKNGYNINEIHVLFNLAINLLRFGIRPIFVFDGKPQKEKKHKTITKKIKTDDKKCYKPLRRNIKIAIRLLKSMGINVIEHNEYEADPICAKISLMYDDVVGVITDDFDILLQGAENIINIQNIYSCHISITNKNDVINNVGNLFGIKFNKFNLIDLCVLLGNDYIERIKIKNRELKFDDVVKLFIDNNMNLNKIIEKHINNKSYISKIRYSQKNYYINYNNFETIRNNINYLTFSNDNVKDPIKNFITSCKIGEIENTEFNKICNYFMDEKRILFYKKFIKDMKYIIEKKCFKPYEMFRYPITLIFAPYVNKDDSHNVDVKRSWRI